MEAVGDVVQFHALVASLVQVLTDFSMKLLANLNRACAERTLAAHEGSHIEPKGPWTGSASVAKGTPVLPVEEHWTRIARDVDPRVLQQEAHFHLVKPQVSDQQAKIDLHENRPVAVRGPVRRRGHGVRDLVQ
jgi:hypothetical protein